MHKSFLYSWDFSLRRNLREGDEGDDKLAKAAEGGEIIPRYGGCKKMVCRDLRSIFLYIFF